MSGKKEAKNKKPSEKSSVFLRKIGLRQRPGVIDEIDDRYARCSLTVEAKHKMRLAVMGAFIYTCDFAFAVASNWQGDTMVSLNSQIAYLGAQKGIC